MKIKDFQVASDATLKSLAISCLRGGATNSYADAKENVTLADRLEAMNGEMDITPEDAVRIRSVIGAAGIPSIVKVNGTTYKLLLHT